MEERADAIEIPFGGPRRSSRLMRSLAASRSGRMARLASVAMLVALAGCAGARKAALREDAPDAPDQGREGGAAGAQPRRRRSPPRPGADPRRVVVQSGCPVARGCARAHAGTRPDAARAAEAAPRG